MGDGHNGVGADAKICACAVRTSLASNKYSVTLSTRLLSVLSYSFTSCDKFLDNLFAIMRCTYMQLVTSVCLYIYMLLVYERVLEKCFLGYWKVLEIF